MMKKTGNTARPLTSVRAGNYDTKFYRTLEQGTTIRSSIER